MIHAIVGVSGFRGLAFRVLTGRTGQACDDNHAARVFLNITPPTLRCRKLSPLLSTGPHNVDGVLGWGCSVREGKVYWDNQSSTP